MALTYTNAFGNLVPAVTGDYVETPDCSKSPFKVLDRKLIGFITIAGRRFYVVALHDGLESRNLQSGWTIYYNGAAIVGRLVGYTNDLVFDDKCQVDQIDTRPEYGSSIDVTEGGMDIVIGDIESKVAFDGKEYPMERIASDTDGLILTVGPDYLTVDVSLPNDAA